MTASDERPRSPSSAAWLGLPPTTAEWVDDHREALDAIFDEFQQSGDWPDPVQLQRKLLADGKQIPVAILASEIPSLIGWREHNPPRVVLSLFGVACCTRAGPLLDAYYRVMRLAIQRHRRPELPNRLERSEAVSALALSEAEADRLSRVILRDAPFLSGGSADLKIWSLGIHERIVEYEHAADASELLQIIAAERGISPRPSPTPPSSTGPRFTPGRLWALLRGSAPPRDLITAVTAAVGLVLTVVVAPTAFGSAAVGACLAGLLLLMWCDVPNWLAGSCLLVGALVGAGAGSILPDAEPESVSVLSVREQLDAANAKIARERALAPASSRPLQLEIRPSGRAAFVQVFKPRPAASKSDMLLIAEVDEGGELQPVFRFQPEATVPAGLAGPGTSALQKKRPLALRVRRAGELDGRPGSDLVLDAARTVDRRRWPTPLYLSWDSAAQRYRLQPLLSPATIERRSIRPYLTRRYAGSAVTRRFLDLYSRPASISDLTGTVPRFEAFATEAYVVSTEPVEDPRGTRDGGLLVRAGYVIHALSFGTPERLQLFDWHLDLQENPLRARAALRPPQVASVAGDVSRLRRVLRRAGQ
jgi:hypothetical protein